MDLMCSGDLQCGLDANHHNFKHSHKALRRRHEPLMLFDDEEHQICTIGLRRSNPLALLMKLYMPKARDSVKARGGLRQVLW